MKFHDEEERLAIFDAYPPPYTEEEAMDTKLQKVLNNEKFLKWLGKQDPEKEYNYWCNRCIIGKYLLDQDVRFFSIGVEFIMITEFEFDNMSMIAIPAFWNEISHVHPWTYGDAYKRAIKVLA